jgi:hypothetical protein
MIVFIAGMSRAGSMWTYNVTRSIYETKNFVVLPESVPIDELDLMKSALVSEEKENEVYCIKTHFPLNSPLPTKHKIKIICNIRDVRDAFLSYIRFTHADFEDGIRAMTSMMTKTDYYLATFKDNLLSVRFEDLTNNPLSVVENISLFLEIDLTKNEKKEIVKKFSKPNVQKKLHDMSKVKLDNNGQIEGIEQKLKFDSIKNPDGSYRVFDKSTAFQTNHITSTKIGEWKSQFDKNKTDLLIHLSREWLLKHGYKP